jgi:hypothetical protein
MKRNDLPSGTGLVNSHLLGGRPADVEPGASLARHQPPRAVGTATVTAAAALPTGRLPRLARAAAAALPPASPRPESAAPARHARER